MMKKTLLLSALALGLIAPAATAITIDDLDGKIVGQCFFGEMLQYGLSAESYVGQFRKVNSTTLELDNFLGAYTIDFTFRNNTLTLNFGSTQYIREFYGTSDSSKSLCMYPVKAGNNFQQGAYYYAGYAINNVSSAMNISASYTQETNGGYFDFRGNYFSAEEYVNDEEDFTSVFYGFHLQVIEPNYIAVEDNDVYGAFVDITGNTITFQNFCNQGYLYENLNPTTSSRGMNLKRSITATIDRNDDFTIPAQVIGGSFSVDYIGYGTLVQGYTVGYWYDSNRTSYYRKYMGANGRTGNITGHILRDQIFHSTGNNMWANDENVNGAELKTLKGNIVEVGKITLFHEFNNTTLGTANKTTYFPVNGEDITHAVELSNVKMGYGNISSNAGNYLYVEGDIVPGENADYVESYQLYVIPGSFSHVTTNAFNNATKGHSNGFLLDGYEYTSWDNVKPNSISMDDPESLHFQYAVPENDLKKANAQNASANAYSFYIKTNYTTESGLEPTFHSLTAFNDRTTGIEEVIDNTAADQDAPVVYYNLNGIEISADALTPGIYIRRQGNTSTKVVIR